VRIWEQALGAKSVGVNDNFFDVGGHSLLLARVRVRIREVFGRDVAMVDLFRNATIARLAAFLDRPQEASQRSFDDARARAQKQRRSQALQRPPIALRPKGAR
jgi:hypothetical protein